MAVYQNLGVLFLLFFRFKLGLFCVASWKVVIFGILGHVCRFVNWLDMCFSKKSSSFFFLFFSFLQMQLCD